MKKNYYNNREIFIGDYRNIEAQMDFDISEEQFIELHKKLIGKSSQGEYYRIPDCADAFIRRLLYKEYGKSVVYNYSKGAQDFFKSKYLSDYFKDCFRIILKNDNSNEEIKNIVNSNKDINNMNEKEITKLCDFAKKYFTSYDHLDKIFNVANCFLVLIYKLDGEGPTSYIKNNISNADFAKHILQTSGLVENSLYYSGRGVKDSDLNESHLTKIFKQLLKYDIEYAVEYVNLVLKMKTLGASEFINSFYNFTNNNFKASISIISIQKRVTDDFYEVSASEDIKGAFLNQINPILDTLGYKLVENNDKNKSFILK